MRFKKVRSVMHINNHVIVSNTSPVCPLLVGYDLRYEELRGRKMVRTGHDHGTNHPGDNLLRVVQRQLIDFTA